MINEQALLFLYGSHGESSIPLAFHGITWAEPHALEWSIVGTNDTNFDGRADILWRNSTTGVVILWTMNGTTHTEINIGQVNTNWKIVGLADLDGAGSARAEHLARPNSPLMRASPAQPSFNCRSST